MYAVIKTGGKQYKVAAGEKIKVETIPADIGAEITIDQVLAVGAEGQFSAGSPLLSGATVSATVLAHGRHDRSGRALADRGTAAAGGLLQAGALTPAKV